MRQTVLRGILLVSLLLFSVWAAEAAEVPVAVSPGSATGALIEGRCPTFSWDAVAGSAAHELVVYQVGEERQVAEPVLRREIPGSASSWTPPLEGCLERGGQYAWSVRAVGEKAASDWSPPSLFQVASGPNQAEFAEALGTVQRYLAIQGKAADENHGPGVSSLASLQELSVEIPASLPPPPGTQLSVAGNVDATSFSGKGTILASAQVRSDGTHVNGYSSTGGAITTSKLGTGDYTIAIAGISLDYEQHLTVVTPVSVGVALTTTVGSASSAGLPLALRIRVWTAASGEPRDNRFSVAIFYEAGLSAIGSSVHRIVGAKGRE